MTTQDNKIQHWIKDTKLPVTRRQKTAQDKRQIAPGHKKTKDKNNLFSVLPFPSDEYGAMSSSSLLNQGQSPAGRTRQNKTRQNKTRQDKIRKTRPDQTRPDKTRQGKTRQDKAGQDQTT
jgi:hypothetical protein